MFKGDLGCAGGRSRRGLNLSCLMLWAMVFTWICTEAILPQSPVTQPAANSHIYPTGIGGDSTWYLSNFEPYCSGGRYPAFWFDISASGGFLLTATGSTVELRHLADRVQVASLICQPVIGQWLKTDQDAYVTSASLDVPSWAIGIEGGMGVTIGRVVNLSLEVDVQDETAGTVWGLARVKINGSDWLLAARDGNQPVRAYPIPYPVTFPCLIADGTSCPRAFFDISLGGGPLVANRLIAGDGPYLGARVQALFKLYNLESGALLLTSSAFVYDADIECFDLSCLLAMSTGQHVEVYQVNPTSARLAAILSTPGATSGVVQLVTNRVQWSGAVLFVGAKDVPGVGVREYLFDFSNPDRPVRFAVPDAYWRHYYRDEGGFRNAAPYAAALSGNLLVRSGWSFLETHRVTRYGMPLHATGFELIDVNVLDAE